MKQPNLLFSCLGISFILIFIGFIFAGFVDRYINSLKKEPFDIGSCYHEYLQQVLRFPDINPFYCKGRRWRYYGFNPTL